jgi:uncharacterized protein YcnI
MSRTISRLLAFVAGLGVLLAAGAMPASAHVSVDPGQAAQGSLARLAFRMPTERAGNSVKLKVEFPTNPLLGHVLAMPHVGWRVAIAKRHLNPPVVIDGAPVSEVVSSVTWTAQSKKYAVGPDEFDEFAVLAGFMPKVDRLYFPATQTYSDGTVINWNQIPSSTNPTPANPAPSLKLVPAGQAAPSSVTLTPSGTNGTVKAASVAERGGSGRTVTLGALIAALVLGGGVMIVRRRRRSERAGA